MLVLNESDAPRHISSSSEFLTVYGRRRSSSLSASQAISRIILGSIGLSTSSSVIAYQQSPKRSPINSLSTSAEALCAICLEALDEEKGDLYTVAACSHTYHKQCIATLKKHSTKCPCCRGPLPDEIGATVSWLKNIPREDVVPEMTTEGMLENLIFGLIGIIWPVSIVALFVLFETACFAIFVVLIFFMAIHVIFAEESHNTTSAICFVIILCIVFPILIVILVICFVLQVFYTLFRTVVFYANIFSCRMRWSNASKFIITRTVILITYVFNVLEEL